jgi:hypothetical protein
MNEDLLIMLASVVGGVLLFVFAITWMALRHDQTKKRMEHEERLKSLELGQPLPDAHIAQAKAASSRVQAVAAVGVLVPLLMAGTAFGSTWLVFQQETRGMQFPLLCIIWGICGLVSLVAAATSLGIIGSSGVPGLEDRRLSSPEPTNSAERSDSLQHEPFCEPVVEIHS